MKHQNPHILVGRSQSSIFVSFSVLGPLLYVLFLNRHLLWTSSEYWGSYLNYYFHVIEEPIRPTTCIIQSGFDICRVMNVLNGSSFMKKEGNLCQWLPWWFLICCGQSLKGPNMKSLIVNILFSTLQLWHLDPCFHMARDGGVCLYILWTDP